MISIVIPDDNRKKKKKKLLKKYSSKRVSNVKNDTRASRYLEFS